MVREGMKILSRFFFNVGLLPRVPGKTVSSLCRGGNADERSYQEDEAVFSRMAGQQAAIFSSRQGNEA